MNRSYAIDVFRGLTIAGMILVNNPGSWSAMYSPLGHAQWHGWTVTDLIFPFFLIIVGISISLSFGTGSKSNMPRITQLREIAIRSAKLYGLGLFLGLFYYQFHNPDYNWITERLLDVRLVGVLHRIALVFLFSTLIYLFLPRRWHLVMFFGLMVLYWTLMMLVPYPLPDGSYVSGMLVPGNNLAAYLDHHIIGAKHLYLENTKPFASDPEGLLSTIPAIASCVGGFFIANIMRESTAIIEQVKKLFIMGVLCLVLAYIAEIWIPFNKNLWTPSYVLLSLGIAACVLAVIVYLTDEKAIRFGTNPLVVFGMNAIALFMLSGIVARIFMMVRVGDVSFKTWIYQFFQQLPVSNETQSLLFACAFLLLMYLPLYWMYQKRIFWKV